MPSATTPNTALAFAPDPWHLAGRSVERPAAAFQMTHDAQSAQPQRTAAGALRFAAPLSLTFLRLSLGPLALWTAAKESARSGHAAVLVGGFLSDYFDGVLARRLGVSRPWLRRLDSAADVVFYVCILVTAYRLEPQTIRKAAWVIALLLASEAACIGVSLWRFGALPATHCYSAKFYGLSLFVVFFGVLALGWGAPALWALGAIGLMANTEVMAILLLSDTPPVDVPSLFALRARQR